MRGLRMDSYVMPIHEFGIGGGAFPRICWYDENGNDWCDLDDAQCRQV